jgi:hypothetical protein
MAHSPGNLALLDWAITGIYLSYLVGVAAFTRGFAKLGVIIAGVPLFVGELTIGVLVFLLATRTLKRRRLPFQFDGVGRMLAAYLAVGGAFAIVGLARGYGVAALRDYALVYYLVFFFFTLAVVRLGVQPEAILTALAIGSVLGAMVAIGSYAITPTLVEEHAAPGYQTPAAWLGGLWCCMLLPGAKRLIWRVLLALGAVLTLVTIYLSATRTMLPIMIVSLAILWVWTIRGKGGDRKRWMRGALSASVAVMIFLAGIVIHDLTLAPPNRPVPADGRVEFTDGLKLISRRWVRGFELLAPTVIDVAREEQTHAAVEDSIAFRLEVWAKALDKIKTSPLTGIGFGPAPGLYPEELCDTPYSPTSNCGNAHNTYITLILRMGIPVFLLFVFLNLVVLARMVRRPHKSSALLRSPMMAPYLAAGLASLLLFGLMSLFFESPYLSPLYWVILGLVHTSTIPAEGPQAEARSPEALGQGPAQPGSESQPAAMLLGEGPQGTSVPDPVRLIAGEATLAAPPPHPRQGAKGGGDPPRPDTRRLWGIRLDRLWRTPPGCFG